MLPQLPTSTNGPVLVGVTIIACCTFCIRVFASVPRPFQDPVHQQILHHIFPCPLFGGSVQFWDVTMGGKKKKQTFENIDSARFDTSKPQFRPLPKQSTKVVIDERFSSVLTDERFQVNVADKYGRRRKQNNDAKEQLSEFYAVEGEEDQRNERPEAESDDESTEEASVAQEADDDVDPASRIAYLTALSRGQLDVSSSSDDDSDDNASSSSDEDSDSDEDSTHGRAGVLDPSNKEEEELTFDETPFMAVMNMDWSHVRAVDIFAIIASFAPPGSVKTVRVYPSDFGMERMKKDEEFGPTDIWKKAKRQKEDNEEDEIVPVHSDEDGSEADSETEEADYGVDPDSGMMGSEQAATDFDPEKLRAYEASRLKYFFAVVEFVSSEAADVAYKEVDGMEFEHSSAAIDMRSIPADQLASVTEGRKLRDEASGLPGNYNPPEFVVSALQQTNVQCTWEAGDDDRARKLTRYVSGQAWQELAENEDLNAYIASDNSSDEESDSDGENGKAARLRKLLGLDDEEVSKNGDQSDGLDNFFEQTNTTDSDDDGDEHVKEAKFIPGQNDLKEKIRSKLGNPSDEGNMELTPWQKYLEKKKQKKRERRQAMRERRKEVNEQRQGKSKQDADPFFDEQAGPDEGDVDDEDKAPLSRNELELLVAGEEGDEEVKDFDMRGIERMERNKEKKLRGARKRKEDAIAANTTGGDFKVNVQDDRFKAVLDGTDERFGIDRTDPNFRETPAMQDILAEQTKRRKKRRKKKGKDGKDGQDGAPAPDVVVNASVSSQTMSSGAAALSSLVSRLKTKVSNQ